jgi:hypothetical protein
VSAAQFGVHRNPSRSTARPFLVVLQSDDYKGLPSRIVAPLVPQSAMPRIQGEHPRIAPVLTVFGRGYVLNPFDLATVGMDRLGDPVASFASDKLAKDKIQDALDAALKPY